MSLVEIIQVQVEQEQRARQLDEWWEEQQDGPPTDRWPRPPWCLDLPLQPETELPSVIVT
jgi:hypothetical protein